MAFLPAYSPELNPDEQVWNHAKADVGKRSIQSKYDTEKTILSVMLAIRNKIDLVKSFFLLPDTLYAKLAIYHDLRKLLEQLIILKPNIYPSFIWKLKYPKSNWHQYKLHNHIKH